MKSAKLRQSILELGEKKNSRHTYLHQIEKENSKI